MRDKVGNRINEGDIVVHGGGTYSMVFYRIIAEPESTKRVRVEALDKSYKNAVGKNPWIMLNLTALFGERYRDNEIIEMLGRKDA